MTLGASLVFVAATGLLPAGVLLGRYGTDPAKAPGERYVAALLDQLVAAVDRHPWRVAAIGLGLLAVTSIGIFKLEVATEFDENFRKTSPIVESYHFVIDRMGTAETLDILIDVPPMDGPQLEDVLETADIFITATGNKDIITAEHMARMKDKAIVGNIGHFDNEIDIAGLSKVPGIQKINIKPQYDEWRFPDGHSVMMLAEGRLLNLGCATGHPSFVMSASFANQVLAQIELHKNNDSYEKKVYRLPKALDEEVARLHLEHLGVKLTKLTQAQADYIGVPIEGPYKPDHYSY